MLKKLILAAAAALIAAPALADGGHRGERPHYRAQGHWNQGHGHGHGHWKHHPRRVVVVPAPHAHYAPPPRVIYAPPPVVHYPAGPVGGVSIRLHFPL